jgi:hypothetical protein
MDITQPDQIHDFLRELGRRSQVPSEIYIFGGSAVLLMGGARHTGDIDFTLIEENAETIRKIIKQVADEQEIDLEESIPSEFMPLPFGSESRHRRIEQYGQLTVYVFDPYSIAMMKLDRAFKSDIQDVHFLIRNGHINLDELEQHLNDVAQRYDEPIKLRKNFEEMKRGL